jgi:hypothetical protein
MVAWMDIIKRFGDEGAGTISGKNSSYIKQFQFIKTNNWKLYR